MTELPVVSSRSRGEWILIILLVNFAPIASVAMGYVLGWMTGVSSSPVGQAAISGIFGIFGALGIIKWLNKESIGPVGTGAAIVLAIMVSPVLLFRLCGVVDGATAPKQDHSL